MIDQGLVEFLKKEIKGGHSEDFLRQGLISKGWPSDVVENSIGEAKRQIMLETYIPITGQPETPSLEEVKTISDKPIIHQSRFDRRTLSISILIFVIIGVILTFTTLVYFYMNGVMSYRLFDPVTGQSLDRTCIYQNCKDLRDFALDFAKQRLNMSIIIGIITSFLIVLIYNLISFKKLFLWIIQILFLIFLLVMGFMWFSFTKGTS